MRSPSTSLPRSEPHTPRRHSPIAVRSAAVLTAIGLALVSTTTTATAQHSIVMTGRFFAQSLDVTTDPTAGKSLTFLEDQAFWLGTPGSGTGALDVYPNATFDTYWGDAYGDGNFTRWAGFTGTFTRFDIAGLFVRNSDKANAAFQPNNVFWTIREDGVDSGMLLNDQSGLQTVDVRPGDWLRLRPNGIVEFFMTLEQFDTACNAAGTTPSFGATAMCQDAAGNLYLSPAEQGGVVVNGNSTPQVAGRDTILRIDAADITYSAAGTIASVSPDSAYVIFDGPTTQGWLAAAGAQDNGRSGTVVPMTSFYNIVGFDLDPNGGMIPATVPIDDPTNPGSDLFPMMPNLVMTADNGFIGGTIWSSSGGGSVAVINGVPCGSTTPGIAATGSWLGTATDGDLLPTLMGMQIVSSPTETPCLIDTPDQGEIRIFDDELDIDVRGEPGQPTSLLIALSPIFDSVLFPIEISALAGGLFAPGSWPDFYAFTPPPFDVPLGVTDPDGYTSFTVANPIFQNPTLQGQFFSLLLVCQAVQLRPATSDVLLSNPIVLQFK